MTTSRSGWDTQSRRTSDPAYPVAPTTATRILPFYAHGDIKTQVFPVFTRMFAMSRRGWTLFLAMAVIWGIPYLLIRVAVRQLGPGVMGLLRTAPGTLPSTPTVIPRG